MELDIWLINKQNNSFCYNIFSSLSMDLHSVSLSGGGCRSLTHSQARGRSFLRLRILVKTARKSFTLFSSPSIN